MHGFEAAWTVGEDEEYPSPVLSRTALNSAALDLMSTELANQRTCGNITTTTRLHPHLPCRKGKTTKFITVTRM
jgi:hypothetical protein